MGFGRDLGAAVTFGLSSTTRQKEAEARHENRRQRHQRQLTSYSEVQEQIRTGLETMDAQFTAAQEVLLSTGALTSDLDNNVTYGWYRPQEEEVEDVENSPDYARSAVGAIPAFGLGIGTPAAIWTLVGIYGTAATGTAIGALSGAAAGAATAAWIGRAATLGMGGMTAGRIALGPIGVAASLLTLPIGAAIAGNKERNYIRKANEAAGKMTRLEGILERCRNRMMPLQPRMAVATADMQRHTGQLETATPGAPEAQDAARKLDIDMRKAAVLRDELAEIIAERDEALRSAGFVSED